MKKPRLRGRYLRILTFFAGMIARFIYWEIILRKIGFRQRVKTHALSVFAAKQFVFARWRCAWAE